MLTITTTLYLNIHTVKLQQEKHNLKFAAHNNNNRTIKKNFNLTKRIFNQDGHYFVLHNSKPFNLTWKFKESIFENRFQL